MKWTDYGKMITLSLPERFSYEECLVFLGRSDQEVLHHIIEKTLLKLIEVNGERVLLKISSTDGQLIVAFPLGEICEAEKKQVVAYLCDWFDLNRDLSAFYEMAANDGVLHSMTERYAGLRMIGIPDLFEALSWAIIGQQINLKFAYTLKKRFVEQFGEKVEHEANTYWLYPKPEVIARLKVDELRALQFTTRKAEYVIGAAKAIVEGELSKGHLREMDREEQKRSFLSLKGVGEWTTDYVRMKCLMRPEAFPITDVGLHNAIKQKMNMTTKPTLEEIRDMAKNWSGWEGYATFYLWRSLYE
jgi:DNA-3-methyladenine glycosylase II